MTTHDHLPLSRQQIDALINESRQADEGPTGLCIRVAQAAIAAERGRQWPKSRDVGRIGDMSPTAFLRVGFDSDNDVYLTICDEDGSADMEFCCPGPGGGKSGRTREALIALMVAMEQDNGLDPGRDWWARRKAPPAPPPQTQPQTVEEKYPHKWLPGQRVGTPYGPGTISRTSRGLGFEEAYFSDLELPAGKCCVPTSELYRLPKTQPQEGETP